MLNGQSIKYFYFTQIIINEYFFLYSNSRQFHTKTRTSNRIGPHSLDVISVLVGCLLGDGYAVKSKSVIQDTSFRFKQSARHKDYLFFLYYFFFTRVTVLTQDLGNTKQFL
jgi:LAGLIDADG DNA endonuclease family